MSAQNCFSTKNETDVKLFGAKSEELLSPCGTQDSFLIEKSVSESNYLMPILCAFSAYPMIYFYTVSIIGHPALNSDFRLR